MSMSKYGLCFDPNDPDLTVAEQDTVGSFLLGKDGDAITSTTIGSVEAIDVNIAGGNLTIAAGSEYAEDSAHMAADTGSYNLSVRQDTLASSTDADGDYQSMKSDSLGRLYVTDDQVLAAIGDVNTELDAQTALLTTIDADTGAIAASVASIDADTTTIISALGDVNTELDAQTALLTSIESNTANAGGVCDTAIANSQNTVNATEESVVASALAARKSLWIANEGKATAYIGNAGVTSANGFPLYRKTAIEICAGPSIDVKAISSAVGADLRVLELS